MRKAINFFIVNMAISDLLITVVYMPRVISILLAGYQWLSEGLTGLVFCKLVYFIHETALSVSIFSAVFISGERFLAVVRPLKTWTKSITTARYLIASTWILSLAMRIPILMANEIDASCGKTYCRFFLDKTFWPGSSVMYHKLNLIGMYATPLGVMVALYSVTLLTLKRRDRPGNRIATETPQPSEIMNKKVSRMVLVVLTAFLLCWLLYFIVAVMESYSIDIPCNVLYLRLVLAHFNCALTPVIYAIFSENYKREFQNILCASCRTTRVRSTTVQQDLDTLPENVPKKRGQTTTELF
ncbi:substance-K receptor-like [Montipora foliosa]|uniref:substance-K receptor-like n=1 Tax=Montipora foliosa TaxID=591990 RepID=UPI0035F15B51